MAKLWDKGYSLDALIERFTVGNDYLLDRRLIASDAVASVAHAMMLESIGVISSEELAALTGELQAIAREAVTGGSVIRREQEDSHTFIEELLVKRLGEAGKRIHTGRSRNDQVIASTRLFAREGLLAVREGVLAAAESLCDLAQREESTPMPGRTHMQPAMPSTVGLWAASYAEALLDSDRLLVAVYGLVNRSPLGAAASFGVPLPLDRELVARLLGCDSIQHNVLDVVSSRGRIEMAILDALDQIGIVMSRFAADLVVFSMPEFGYFALPAELCSGSSIMPQKRNPDGLELMRGKSATLSACADQVRNVVRSMPSGYNRDVQETKEPLMRGIDLTVDMLAVADLTSRRLEVNRERLAAGFTADIFATDAVMDRVASGTSFRDAYREVASVIGSLDVGQFDLGELIRRRSSTGAPGNLGLEHALTDLDELRRNLRQERARVAVAVAGLAGVELPLYPGTPAER